MNCLYQTKRISDLKEKMLSSKRYASIEQARIITRVYQENEGVTPISVWPLTYIGMNQGVS